jgi:hypothetical protein
MFLLVNSCINFELNFWDSNLNELKLNYLDFSQTNFILKIG